MEVGPDTLAVKHVHVALQQCQNSVLKSEILSKRFGKSRDEFWGLGYPAPKGNPSGSDKPIIEGVGSKMQPAGIQAVPFGGLS